MIITTNAEEVRNYYANPAISQSTLKELSKGFESFMEYKSKKKNESTPTYFLIGSAIDCILTGEEGDFENQYHISTITSLPSDTEQQIVKSVFQEVNLLFPENMGALEDYPETILKIANELSWQPKWKDETRINKIITNCSEYFEDLVKAGDKSVLSIDQATLVDTVVKSLRESPVTGKYFNREKYKDHKTIDIYYQVPLYFKYNGLDMKALLDMVIVRKDREGKIDMIQPVDLKTMSGYTTEFFYNFKRLRYDIQSAFYILAIKESKKFGVILDEEDIIKPFIFVVESTTSPGIPLEYVVDEETLTIGKEGLSDSFSNNPWLVGFDNLIEDYKYYESINWECNKLVKESKGRLSLSIIKGASVI